MTDGWCKGCNLGLVLELEAVMAGNRTLWCKHLDCDIGLNTLEGLAWKHSDVAERAIRLEVIVICCCLY